MLFSRPKGKKSESGASDERRAYLSYASLELTTTGHKLVEFQRPQLAPINHYRSQKKKQQILDEICILW